MKKLPTILPELLPSMGATPEDSVIVEYHSGFAEATPCSPDENEGQTNSI